MNNYFPSGWVWSMQDSLYVCFVNRGAFHVHNAKTMEGLKIESNQTFTNGRLGILFAILMNRPIPRPLLVTLTRGGKVLEVRYFAWGRSGAV
jgi:hypothetical protein